MQIHVSMTLGEAEPYELSADETAAAVLEAVGANPAVDYCAATITRTSSSGAAGRSSGAEELPK